MTEFKYKKCEECSDRHGMPICHGNKEGPPPGCSTEVSPSYYTRGNIQCTEFIVDQGLDFREGNVVKYLVRYKYKNGKEDLLKAKKYLEMIIESLDIE